MFAPFLQTIGLQITPSGTENNFVAEALSITPKEINLSDLYTYPVPQVSQSGGCDLKKSVAPEPYDLSPICKINDEENKADHPNTIRLWRLNQIIQSIEKRTQVDWIGIYRKAINTQDNLVLVKEAYHGEFSRAEFPLNEDFAKNSNNSTVGLTQKAVVFQDLGQYQGPYYKCDSKVRAEFCLPILDEEKNLLGIIDAEAWKTDFFTDENLLEISKIAHDLGQTDLLKI
mgnify:CR=1 FL=1